LQTGRDGCRKGAIPNAVIQRAIKSGGIFFLPPIKQDRYIDIVRLNLKKILAKLKVKSQLSVEVDESILQMVVDIAIHQRKGTRGLDEILKYLTQTAVSEAFDRDMPMRGISIRISVNELKQVVVEHLSDEGIVKNSYPFEINSLLRSPCEMRLISQAH
jgi:ATP-dependent Clp protease ATP-binding subunit ClpA